MLSSLPVPRACATRSATMASELMQTFTSIGLSEQKAKETLKNQAVTENLKSVIDEVSLEV